MPWGVGSKVPTNVYDGDRHICQCYTIEDARQIVDAVNVRQELLDALKEAALTIKALHREPDRLIAAAPDLLDALKGAVAHCVGWRKFQKNERSVPFLPRIMEDGFRAAIAKAEGASAALAPISDSDSSTTQKPKGKLVARNKK